MEREHLEQGSIYLIVKLPSPWPSEPTEDVYCDPNNIRIFSDHRGRFTVELLANGELVRTETFQPLRIRGNHQVVLTAVWSASAISLRVNLTALSPDRDVNGAELLLETPAPPEQLPRCPIFMNLPVIPAKSAAERLFLNTIADIDSRVAKGGPYELIRAAGLLRQLFLDDMPLVHVVNRRHRLRLEFDRSAPASEVVDDGFTVLRWINPDPTNVGARHVTLNLADFLQSPVLVVGTVTATVGDVIRVCAHVKGGIHLGKARTEAERALIDWDDALTFAGEQTSTVSLEGICLVALRGLVPLVQAAATFPVEDQ